MNFLQAINNVKSSINNNSLSVIEPIILENNKHIIIPNSNVNVEEVEEEFHYLDNNEFYNWNLAIDDIINRRINDSYIYYQETGEYDIFAKESMLNKEYLENYPMFDEDEEYYEEE